MRESEVRRKLAVIVAADIAGYSCLIGADEEATLTDYRRHRQELIEPLVAEHGGRIANTAGDSLLIEFASVVESLRAAMRIQEGLAARNADVEAGRRIELRIGINIGDVMAEGEDLLGDGVNIAARLEALAPPGGICLSSAARDQVRDRLEVGFEDLGEVEVKNIARPVRVWQWTAASAPAPARAETDFTLPDKPSIAVLSFDNMSHDPEQEFFADGIAEDIITALSRIDSFFVAARNSSFTYKGRAVDVQQIGHELGVRYVVEGSVRTAGSRIRVTAQLIDALTGRHVWADKYDRSIDDIFKVQDEITRNVVACTQTEIMFAEASLFEDIEEPSLPVWGLICRAQRQAAAEMTRESFIESTRLADQALALDPSSGRAHQIMAFLRFHNLWLGFSDDPAKDLDDARRHAERAVRLNSRDESAHWILGMVRLFVHEHDSAIAAMERAIEINPNYSRGYGSLATVLNFAGEPRRSIEMNQIALRSNPIDPGNAFRYCGLAISHVLLGEYDEALAYARRIMQTNPDWYMSHVILIVALDGLGQSEAARRAVAALRAQLPSFSVGDVDGLPFRRADDLARIAGPFSRVFEEAGP